MTTKSRQKETTKDDSLHQQKRNDCVAANAKKNRKKGKKKEKKKEMKDNLRNHVCTSAIHFTFHVSLCAE